MKIHTTIEKELDAHGHGFFQTVGDSMEPILHNRSSTVVIEKIVQPLKVYDVVLFKRFAEGNISRPDAYVLHRIVKIRKDDYLICGDNLINKESVPKEQILGIMKGYFDGEDYIDCEHNLRYLKYLKKLKLRYFCRWAKSLWMRILNKGI